MVDEAEYQETICSRGRTPEDEERPLSFGLPGLSGRLLVPDHCNFMFASFIRNVVSFMDFLDNFVTSGEVLL